MAHLNLGSDLAGYRGSLGSHTTSLNSDHTNQLVMERATGDQAALHRASRALTLTFTVKVLLLCNITNCYKESLFQAVLFIDRLCQNSKNPRA